ncbi:hypothetical protein A4X09_0g5191 [Tilletia walkeri]|uniref:Uncharacterized protein n=1 Tax=Tilletia walkeri TaxID=117179 RepID=A0A8X7N681_9BASI|nr:hypothetical protein A4X09_0g5191 [Tilletia walkeri]
MQFFTLALLALPAAILASPITTTFEKRAPAVNCGGKAYTSTQVNRAVSYSNSDAAPSTTYPHTYNNYEGFNFGGYCSDSSYSEYPLTSTGYTGGSPGPDRVIVGQQSRTFCGAITHTGASSYNGFVRCSY